MTEPIRILHMIGSLNIGGSQSMVINIHESLDKSKVQFDYIIDHPDHLYFAEKIKKLGGKIYTMPTFKGFNYFEIRSAWKHFFKQHPEYKILHSHVRSYASLYLPIAKKAGLKTIIHSHSTSNGSGLSSIVKRVLQYPLRYQADYFFGCSKEAGEWLLGKKIVDSPKYHVLKNAIDVEKYAFNMDNRVKLRSELGLGDKLTFVHVGRFHPAKNHLFLLNIFSEIHKRNPNTALLLVGDGELRPSIERQIAKLNLKNDVLLLGSRSDIPCILHAADCFLFPSIWEGFGMVAVEAQAAGLPCICSDSVPRSVKVTDNCSFVPINNLNEWVEKASTNLNSAKLLCRSSRTSIIEMGYDIKENAKILARFYIDNIDVDF